MYRKSNEIYITSPQLGVGVILRLLRRELMAFTFLVIWNNTSRILQDEDCGECLWENDNVTDVNVINSKMENTKIFFVAIVCASNFCFRIMLERSTKNKELPGINSFYTMFFILLLGENRYISPQLKSHYRMNI